MLEQYPKYPKTNFYGPFSFLTWKDTNAASVYAGTFVMKKVGGRSQLKVWWNHSGHFKPKYAKYVSGKFGFPLNKFKKHGSPAHFMRDNLLGGIFEDDYDDYDDYDDRYCIWK